jgi:predicted benzoate:H+ symporter BenE
MTTFEILFALGLFALTFVLVIALGLIKQHGDQLAASVPPETAAAIAGIATALIPLAEKGLEDLGEIAAQTPNRIDDTLFAFIETLRDALIGDEDEILEANDDKA